MSRARHRIESAADTIYASAGQIAAAVQAKQVSALEVTETHLARIAKVNPALNALVTVDSDGARAAARVIDKRIANGEIVGKLAGVPISTKEPIEVAGIPCTAGTLGRKGFLP